MNNYTTYSQIATSGVADVTMMGAVNYIQHALLASQTNLEAALTFVCIIESLLNRWFTQFEFFLHNFVQLRFSATITMRMSS